MNYPGWEEDDAFAKWREASEEDKGKHLSRLVKSLRRHAFAVCQIKLREPSPDIVSLAVWVALKKSARFRGECKFSSWFQGIVQNLCMDSVRGKAGRERKQVSLEDVGDIPVTNVAGVEARVELGQLTKDLNDQHKALVSFKLRGLNDKEISMELGLTEMAVRHAWGRAKEKIREAGA